MNRHVIKIYIACLIFLSFLAHGYHVSALTFDPVFGKGGIVTTKVGNYVDRAQAITVQADGKILVAGSSSNNANLDFALVRYNPDGTVDTTFNSTGQVVTAVGNGDDVALGVALQADGKIVTCGYTYNGKDLDFAILRFTGEGILDADFGVGGIVTLPVSIGNDVAAAVAVQEDGAILVAGTVETAAHNVGALLRFLSNGELDPSFGTAGRVFVDIGSNAEVTAMAVQKDKNIVLAGSCEDDGQKKILLARLSSDGLPDAGFGVGGVVKTAADTRDVIGNSLWVQDDGAILVAGSAGSENNRDVALLRIRSTGELDREFGVAGMVSYDMSGTDDVAYAVSANLTTIYVAGYATMNGLRDFILLQYPLGHSAAPQFSVVSTGVAQFNGVAQALALEDDATIVTAGFSEESGTSSFAVARYVEKEGVGGKAASSGAESPFIQTTALTEITRVGCFTGGEIKAGSGLTFSGRGVVYSIAPYPSLTSTGTNTSTAKSVSTSSSSTVSTTEGFTSDGSGEGRYGSILSNLTPGTLYYVRAYGVASDGSVYYGNQLSFETRDACFIATAAYGSLLDPHVRILRLFRDQYLLSHEAGKTFVRLYYHYSPPVAALIAEQPLLRLIVRVVLVPMILCSYVALHWGLAGLCASIIVVLAFGAAGLHAVRQKILAER